MIENERELRAAEEWISYWKSTRGVGQSWIANEQAAKKIAELRREIDDYRRRQSASPPPSAAEETVPQQPAAGP